MADQVAVSRVLFGFEAFLDETFEKVEGFYLNKGNSFFETLETITAEQASRPMSSQCATIAAHVAHVEYYLEVLAGYMLSKPLEIVNWREVWDTVNAVTVEEWDALKAKLKATYQRVRAEIKAKDTWSDEDGLPEVLSILVHSAYHLGEIRQATCFVKYQMSQGS